MNERKKMGNKGFTLIEVLLSIAILALISVPLMKYFADSLRYSVQTAEKQKATMIAQETVEFIRSQKKIVKWNEVTTTPMPVATTEPDPDADPEAVTSPTPEPTPVVPTTTKQYFLAPELAYKFGGYTTSPEPEIVMPEQFVATGATLGTAGSPEPLIYRYVDQKSGTYYIEVSLNCTMPEADVSSPAIMQIDDSRNVVVAERTEVADAITHFSTLNLNQYLARHGGTMDDPDMTPTPSPDPFIYASYSPDPDDPIEVTEYKLLSEAEIRENMDRIIYVEISKGAADTKYTISAYYQFFCKDVFGPGTDSNMEYPSATLCEANVEHLDGIFLMFNKMSAENDYIQIIWNVEGDDTYPDFRFVVQDDIATESDEETTETTEEGGDPTTEPEAVPSADPEAVPSADPETETPTEDPADGYKLYVEWSGFDFTLAMPNVHSNLPAGNFAFGKPVSEPIRKPQDAIEAPLVPAMPVYTLTGSGVPVRIFDIGVKVYANQKAYTDGEDPLVELKTTKVE